MDVERLFAQIHRSIDIGDVFMERVRTNGFLTQCLSQHLRAGGPDPREEHAEDMMAAGAPLERSVRPVARAGHAAPGWMMYVNAKEKPSSSVSQPRDKRQRVQARTLLKAEFDNLPQEEQDTWNAKAAEAHFIKRQAAAREAALPEVEPLPEACGPTPMCGLSGDGLPLSHQAFLAAAESDPAAAFNQWGQQARKEFRDTTFVKDANRIPPKKKISLWRSCWQRHSGVCQSKDSSIYEPCLKSGAALSRYLWDKQWQFTWVRADLTAADQHDVMVAGGYFWVAYTRGANPLMSLFLAGQQLLLRKLSSKVAESPDFPLGVSDITQTL
ncbi:unnamed protein product, partial [Prorocentrum cordatum]